MYSSGGNDEKPINMMVTTCSRKELQLQGPRPPPLKVLLKDSIYSASNKVISKKPTTNINHDSRHLFIGRRHRKSNLGNQPIVIHLRSPKIIHTRPQDFMDLVQQLTGNHHHQCAEANVEEDDHWNNSDETRSNKEVNDDEGMIINNKDIKDDDPFLELQLNCSSASSDQGVSTISSLKGSKIFSPVFANTRFISSPPNTCTISSNWQDFGGSIFG
ncbi:VQ motif-containing protein 20-like [Papaver somniferum]|uniref:VQ motif-containing protein 20-like n=1 Tax=Papaver somniferum TaxID=3469 RepID=UPI000E6FBD4A|nr:VQ motif-containing protein 20-like [Papaver somniferum]